MNLWGQIFVDCGFLLICGDVNSWSVFSFSKKLTLSNFIFIDDVNSRGIHEYHKNWAMTNSNISTVPTHCSVYIHDFYFCVCVHIQQFFCAYTLGGINPDFFYICVHILKIVSTVPTHCGRCIFMILLHMCMYTKLLNFHHSKFLIARSESLVLLFFPCSWN